MFRWLLQVRPFATDTGLLLLRLSTSLLMMPHGWQKFSNYSEWSKDFPDPLHVGSPISLALCILAELFCSGLLAIGLFTRIALIPLIINMLVVVLMVHGGDPFEDKEHGLLFLIPQIALFLIGPGKYSVDALIRRNNS